MSERDLYLCRHRRIGKRATFVRTSAEEFFVYLKITTAVLVSIVEPIQYFVRMLHFNLGVSKCFEKIKRQFLVFLCVPIPLFHF